MPNQDIFCNAPWYELQIYWDGSLGFCCQATHHIYSEDKRSTYNVKNMSIAEWFNSEPMKKSRLSMHDSKPNSFCSLCYREENISGTSRRHKCNQKSVIFTKGNFKESYTQSPGYKKFEHSLNNSGHYDGMPIDLHIDLGNYCNLACKMCFPWASSAIASQYVQWGDLSAKQYLGSDWTRDQQTWTRILNEIADIPNLKNIHFMGGETLITKRFEEFVDFMIDKQKFDICFSFVTNGMIFNETLINKLTKFKRVGIEVSIESLTEHNHYQRQGTDTKLVLNNLEKYFSYCDNQNITVTLRPTISALTIGSYYTLLEYALNKKLVIKDLMVIKPEYLNPNILPVAVKQLYIKKYYNLKEKLPTLNYLNDFNESNPNEYQKIILGQIDQCITLLTESQPLNADQLLTEMVEHCRLWDNIYRYNALELYPELTEEFVNRGY